MHVNTVNKSLRSSRELWAKFLVTYRRSGLLALSDASHAFFRSNGSNLSCWFFIGPVHVSSKFGTSSQYRIWNPLLFSKSLLLNITASIFWDYGSMEKFPCRPLLALVVVASLMGKETRDAWKCTISDWVSKMHAPITLPDLVRDSQAARLDQKDWMYYLRSCPAQVI